MIRQARTRRINREPEMAVADAADRIQSPICQYRIAQMHSDRRSTRTMRRCIFVFRGDSMTLLFTSCLQRFVFFFFSRLQLQLYFLSRRYLFVDSFGSLNATPHPTSSRSPHTLTLNARARARLLARVCVFLSLFVYYIHFKWFAAVYILSTFFFLSNYSNYILTYAWRNLCRSTTSMLLLTTMNAFAQSKIQTKNHACMSRIIVVLSAMLNVDEHMITTATGKWHRPLIPQQKKTQTIPFGRGPCRRRLKQKYEFSSRRFGCDTAFARAAEQFTEASTQVFLSFLHFRFVLFFRWYRCDDAVALLWVLLLRLRPLLLSFIAAEAIPSSSSSAVIIIFSC